MGRSHAYFQSAASGLVQLALRIFTAERRPHSSIIRCTDRRFPAFHPPSAFIARSIWGGLNRLPAVLRRYYADDGGDLDWGRPEKLAITRNNNMATKHLDIRHYPFAL